MCQRLKYIGKRSRFPSINRTVIPVLIWEADLGQGSTGRQVKGQMAYKRVVHGCSRPLVVQLSVSVRINIHVNLYFVIFYL